MKKIAMLAVACLLSVLNGFADSDPEARRIMQDAYDQVFGPQGCSLKYDVNLVGIYKTAGTIWYKEKKSKFDDSKLTQWNDGTTAYAVYKKKKVIEVFDVKSGKHDKYGSKFKFTLDDFDYQMERAGDNIIISLKQKRGAKGTVKQAKVALDARTHAPKHIKVKVALFWANIHVSNFKSGGISDDLFVFPRSHYGSEYRWVDKRNERD